MPHGRYSRKKTYPISRIPDRNSVRSNWPAYDPVPGISRSERADIGARDGTGKSQSWKVVALIVGTITLAMILARKPITSGAKMLMDKVKIKELLSKYGNMTFAVAPAEAKPASLAKVYPSITNPETKARLDTIPLNKLWGIEGFYSFNPDTAMVNSVKKIASGPEEFVKLMKGPATEIAKKYGMSDPKIIVAQAGHEGGWGKSAIGGTNLFGHVATAVWSQNGGKYSFENTWEDTKSGPEKTVRPFRVYDSLAQALDGHMQIIKKWPDAFKAKTPEQYADALTGGKLKYATDAKYKSKLVDAYNTVAKYW